MDHCMFDNQPIFEDELCEECYGETVYMTTCDYCQTDEHTRVIQGRVNAYYECAKCGDNWM